MTDWPAVVGRHANEVWRTAYRLVGNDADASDCVQEAFMAVLDIARRETVQSHGALLRRVATRKALDHLRRRIRDRARYTSDVEPDTLYAADPGPADRLAGAELADRLRAALPHLPEPQAEVFCLCALDGMSYRDAAHALQMTSSAVGVALHRARAALRERLGATGAKVEATKESGVSHD